MNTNYIEQNPMAALTSFGLGYLYSAAIRAVVELGIADVLADGPKTAGELAKATATSPSHLGRVLRALAGCGLFVQNSNDTFELTTTGSLLRRDHEGSLRDAVLMMTSDAFVNAGTHLLKALYHGGNAFAAIQGLSFFDYLQKTPDAAQEFHRGMANFSETENGPIAAAYDFSRFSTVVDVGGGYGGFLETVLLRTPGVRGLLYETAAVVQREACLKLSSVADRCVVEAGDFFEKVPAGADCYILKRCLHDWSDEECHRILRNCRNAVVDGGRVLIIDAVVQEDNQPCLVKNIDLLMLAASDGRERTAREFTALLAKAGFELGRILATPSLLSIIEAIPA